jgi:cysteine-rich repeat protein
MKAHVVAVVAVLGIGCGKVEDPDGPPPPDGGTNAVCGDGTREAAEECDDGNVAAGDGCDAGCKLDHACILTHDGGSPARISSLNLAPTGQFTQLRTVTLGDNDSPPAGEPRGFSSIAVCGRHVYAAMDSSNVIAHLELDASGALAARASTPLVNVHSLLCEEDRPLLVAFAATRTPAASTMTAFEIGADGSLTSKGTLSLVFGAGGSTLSSLMVANHPTTKDIWVVGYSGGAGPGANGALSYRVAVADDGAVAMAEGPSDIGGSSFGNQIVLRPDGALMVMAGFSGGCTGAWRLASTGALPTAAERIHACSGNFANGNHVALRPASTVFYQSTGAGELRVSSVNLAMNVLVDHGTMTLGTGDLHLALAYGGSVLISADATTGAVRAHTVGVNEIALTPAGSQTAPAGSTRGLVVARCGR